MPGTSTSIRGRSVKIAAMLKKQEYTQQTPHADHRAGAHKAKSGLPSDPRKQMIEHPNGIRNYKQL
jgi:hypothetical protein